MRRTVLLLLIALLPTSAGPSCLPLGPLFSKLPVETRFSFVNLSTRYYAVLGIREHVANGEPGDWSYTSLLAPGATARADFEIAIDSGCPDSIDLRLLLYPRVNEEVPIGLDETEAVESTPIVAGELLDVPACSVQVLETYTLVNWDAPEGVGRLKIAQCSTIDTALADSGRLDDELGVWEIQGVDPSMAGMMPASLAETEPIMGRVVLADGSGVAGVGLLIRAKYRVELDCGEPANEDHGGYGDPIAVTVTDASGAFRIDRPAGVYQLEFFSDDYAFRPAFLEVETPLPSMTLLAEPVP